MTAFSSDAMAGWGRQRNPVDRSPVSCGSPTVELAPHSLVPLFPSIEEDSNWLLISTRHGFDDFCLGGRLCAKIICQTREWGRIRALGSRSVVSFGCLVWWGIPIRIGPFKPPLTRNFLETRSLIYFLHLSESCSRLLFTERVFLYRENTLLLGGPRWIPNHRPHLSMWLPMEQALTLGNPNADRVSPFSPCCLITLFTTFGNRLATTLDTKRICRLIQFIVHPGPRQLGV